MADEGYAYVPRACETERCRVHVAFHGCRQGAETIGERFVREAGYNRWADSNRLIVLYPQAIARYFWIYNPRGCWDWWGYTGTNYATKEGAQIRAVWQDGRSTERVEKMKTRHDADVGVRFQPGAAAAPGAHQQRRSSSTARAPAWATRKPRS